MIRKTFAVEHKTIDADQGIFEAMISTEEIDRDGDILLASGVELDNYLKNPVVVFSHSYSSPDDVVGRAMEVQPMPGKGVRAKWRFVSDGINQRADLVRRLWAGGFLNAISVGFIPKQASEIKDGDNPDEYPGRIFSQWELLEFSIVVVPSNQSALRLAMKTLGESDSNLTATLQSNDKAVTSDTEISQDGHSIVTKRGRVLSAKNEGKLRQARDLLSAVIAQVEEQIEDEKSVLTANTTNDGIDYTYWKGNEETIVLTPAQSLPEPGTALTTDEDTVNPPESAPDSAEPNTDDTATGQADHDKPEPDEAAVLEGFKAFLDELEQTLH
jgi:hypothetical protein